MDLSRKEDLERYFAENLNSRLFPVLADLYLKDGDLNRARKVCRIGLDNYPENASGWYVLAQICQSAGELNEAEKYLKLVVKHSRSHIQGRIDLARLQTSQERSPNTIIASWTKVLRLYPDFPEAVEETARLKTLLKKEPEPEPALKAEPAPPPKKPVKPETEKENLPEFSVSPRMATLTLARVLKEQGLYYQALEVLAILAQKGGNEEQVNIERQEIELLMREIQPD